MANSLLRIETLRYEQAEIQVQCPTVLTQLRRDDLARRMNEGEVFGVAYLDLYLDAVTMTQKAKGLPFSLPEYSAPTEAHLAVFEQMLNLPTELLTLWRQAMNRANMPPGGQANEDAEDKQESPKAEGASANVSPA